MSVESRQPGQKGPSSNQDWAEMRRLHRRPTAPQSFQRPPDPTAETFSSWWPVFWLLCLLTVTGLMVFRQYTTTPTTSFDLPTLRQQSTAMLPSWLGGRIGNGGDVPVEPQTDSVAVNVERPLLFSSEGDALSASNEISNESGAAGVSSRWSLSNLRTMFSGVFSARPFSAGDGQSSNRSGQDAEPGLVIEDDFREPRTSLASAAETDRWMMDFLPTVQIADQAGVYRMRTWPGTIAWTSIGDTSAVEQFRLEVTMQINPLVPEGYGGFLARYQDEQNYYLFLFDGNGDYRSMLREDGQWSSSQDWTNKAAVNLAGQVNEIALEERESVLRLYANGALIDELTPVHPSGYTGLVGGAKLVKTNEVVDGKVRISEVDYHRLTIYELY